MSRKKPEIVGIRPKKRLCLSCGRPFKSKGIHNRICPSCKGLRVAFRGVESMTCVHRISVCDTIISEIPLVPMK